MKSIRILLALVVTTASVPVAIMAMHVGDARARTAIVASAFDLDASASELKFVTTKNTSVAEVQQFKRLSGSIAPSGAVMLSIDLASVETNVPIRNERLQTMLFEVAQFPSAQFEAGVDLAKIGPLNAGDTLDMDVAGKLSLHGQTQAAIASLRIVALVGNRMLVTTRAPILVTASQFDLAPGIEKLREIMALPNIVGTVPVTFSLVFQRRG